MSAWHLHDCRQRNMWLHVDGICSVAIWPGQNLRPFMPGKILQTQCLNHSNVYMQICREHNVWLHVDGAWGGAALLSRKLRHLMAGCERADSVCWNPHKLLVRDFTHAEAGSLHMQM